MSTFVCSAKYELCVGCEFCTGSSTAAHTEPFHTGWMIPHQDNQLMQLTQPNAE